MPLSLLSAGQRLTLPGLDRVLRQGDALLVLASLSGAWNCGAWGLALTSLLPGRFWPAI